MFKLEKINSLNSGPHITNDNIIFNLDDYGSIDLSKSYFNIRARIDCTTVGAAQQGTAYNVALASVGSTHIPYGNSIFFKHWTFESQKSGIIEDIRNVNMLKANLDCLTRSSEDKKSGNYNTLSQYYNDTFTSQNWRGSVFSNLHNFGSVNSTNVVANMKMNVSDVGGVGMLDVYDLDKQGLSRATLQLDTSYLTPIQHNPYPDTVAIPCVNIAIGTAIQQLGQGGSLLQTSNVITPDVIAIIVPGMSISCTRTIAGATATVTSPIVAVTNANGIIYIETNGSLGAIPIGQTATLISFTIGQLLCDNYQAAGAQELGIGDAALVTTTTYPYDKSKLFVGQSITVTRDINAGGVATVQATIASITLLATNKLSITTVATCGAVANGQDVDSISIGTNACTMNLVVEDVNFVAVKHMSKVPSPNSQIFSSWNLEQANVPATTQYNHLFEIEPNVINVLALSPTTATNPISVTDSLSSYRIRVDDIDQTNRDVEFKSSLYYDSLMRTCNNMGSDFKLKNLYPTVGNGVEMALITSPISMSGRPQMLQLSYTNSVAGTAKVLSLYKQVVKKL